MGKPISVSLYIARVHERGSKEYLQLDRLGRSDFITLAHTVLRNHHNQFVELAGGRRRLQITTDLKQVGRVLDGVIDVGEAGHTSVMKDVNSGVETYRRRETDVEMVPLYFRAWSPTGGRFAAFAFQHFGDYGCKTPIYEMIAEEMKTRFPHLVLTMREAVPEEVVSRFFKKGLVKQLRFTRFGIPKDRADSYGSYVANPADANVELNIIAKRGNGLSLGDLAKSLFGRQEVSSKQFLELDGVEYNRFKMRVSLDGKDRWLTVGQFMTMHSKLDVSDDIDRDPNGHPNRQSIELICQALLEKIALEHRI